VSSSRCLPRLSAKNAQPCQPALLAQEFHSTRQSASFQPTWMPMRVKTPWIDALTKQRSDAALGRTEQQPETESAKPDLTPKRMSDSYYSAVSLWPDLL
jgi:acyl-coenzyme A thioesterase 9